MDNISRLRKDGKSQLEVGDTLYTASVLTRHKPDCIDAKYGPSFENCKCRKSVLVYDGSTKKQTKISPKTRSWTKAVAFAEAWLDRFDPTKRAQKALEEQAVTVEKAIGVYLGDLKFRQLADKTIKRTKGVLGDPDNHKGKLLEWLAGKALLFIADITSSHLTEWRNSWEWSDSTSAVSWDTVKSFFKFCKGQGWIAMSPAENLRRPKIEQGSRTGVFTDEQYDKLLATVDDQRLEAFLELMRWGGMAIIDAVLFDPKTVDASGVLRYKRKKTGKLATTQLPEHVVILLRNVPLESDNTASQPFRRSGLKVESDIADWRNGSQHLFGKAGIKEVKTDLGMRPPHPHMLRDTCAVWYLRHGMSTHSVAKILGDTTATVEKHYLPFVKELEEAHLKQNADILKAAKPKLTGKVEAIA